MLHQPEETDDFGSKLLGVFESLSEKHGLSDELYVRHRHCHWPKQLLEVIRQFGSATISLSSWVHGDKNTCILIDRNVPSHELESWSLLLDSPLNDLDLLRNS